MRYFVHAENVARWSVLLLLFLLPFFFVPNAWAGVAGVKMSLAVLAAGVGMLAWALAAFYDGVLRIPKSLLLFASALVPVAYFTSALATGASRASFIGDVDQDTVIAIAVWWVLLFVCANALGSSPSRSTAALRIFFCGSVLLLLLEFIHLLFPALTFGGALLDEGVNPLGGWHDLAIFLGLLLFLSLALLPTTVGSARLFRALLPGVAVASAVLLLVVNSGDVWLGLASLGLLCAVYLWDSGRKEGVPTSFLPSRRAAWWLLFALVALGLYWGGPYVHDALPPPLQTNQVDVRPSWQGTFTVAAGVFKQPAGALFGSGPNTFLRDWGLYKPLSVNETQFWDVDFEAGVGFIPTSIVTVGLIGVLAWAALLFALLRGAWEAFRARRIPAGTSGARGALALGALYLAAFHWFSAPGPALTTLTFMLFGLLIAEELSGGTVRDLTVSLSWRLWKWRSWKEKIGVVVLSTLMLALFWAGVQSARALLSNMLVNRAAASYASTGDIGIASRSVTHALGVLSKNDNAHRAAVQLGMIQITHMIAANDTSDAAGAKLRDTVADTVGHALTAVKITPDKYQNWLLLGNLYQLLAGLGVENAEENAQRAYQEAQKSNPTSPLPLLSQGQIDLAAKDDAAARGHLEAALALKPDLAVALFLLSQIDARAGDFAKARDEAAAAAQEASQDPLGWYNLGTIYYATGNYQDAVTVLTRATALQNDYANALFLLGVSYYKLGRKEDALSAFDAVVALSPDDAGLATIIANIRAGKKDPFLTSTSASTSAGR